MKATLRVFVVFFSLALLFAQCEKEPKVNNDSVDIPDQAFLDALIEEGVDINGDSFISYAEAETVISLDVSGGLFELGSIIDMAGIEAFINLDSLKCGYNQLTSINVSGNTSLRYLSINSYYSDDQDGGISLLDLTKNTSLEVLICVGHKLTNLDVKNNLSLKYLDCAGNEITNLELSKNVALETLICEGNKIASLDLSNNFALTDLIVGVHTRFPGTSYESDHLTSLNITNCTVLGHLNVRGCSLSSLDISNNTALYYLNCANGKGQLTTLDLSHNTALTEIIIFMNESLNEVCVWTMPFPPQNVHHLEDDGCPNLFYTTECSDF